MSNSLVQWANAALDLRDLTIVVVDTTGIATNSDIVRFLAIDRHGNLETDMIITSGRKQGPNTQYTGITQEELDDALPLESMWPDIRAAIRGRYVVGFGLRFIQARLNENAAYYGLMPQYILGQDLIEMATPYFSSTRFVKLADACNYISHPLPLFPSALERAKGALELMKRMAAGPYLPLAQPPTPGKLTATDEMDERPF